MMRVNVNILNHIFVFTSEHKEIIEYIEKTYEQYVIGGDISGQDYYYTNIDELIGKNSYAYVSIIKNVIINTVSKDGMYYLMHAGIVIVNGSAVLLCGSTQSGKSTACYLLSEMYGVDCMADDVAFVHKESFLVNWIKFPIKLRENVANKYKLRDKALLNELNDDGDSLYNLRIQHNGVSNQFAPIGLVIEIQYVNDISLQSSRFLSGREAIITILSNSYSQNRLYDSYGTIVRIAQDAIVKKVKYNDPEYLYYQITSALEKGKNGEE